MRVIDVLSGAPLHTSMCAMVPLPLTRIPYAAIYVHFWKRLTPCLPFFPAMVAVPPPNWAVSPFPCKSTAGSLVCTCWILNSPTFPIPKSCRLYSQICCSSSTRFPHVGFAYAWQCRSYNVEKFQRPASHTQNMNARRTLVWSWPMSHNINVQGDPLHTHTTIKKSAPCQASSLYISQRLYIRMRNKSYSKCERAYSSALVLVLVCS